MSKKWSEFKETITDIKIEDEKLKLVLYSYKDDAAFNGRMYALVLDDDIILIDEEYPERDWDTYEMMYELMLLKKRKRQECR